MRRLITTAAPNGGGVTFPPEPRMEEPVAWGDGGESSLAAGVLRHRVFRTEPWAEPEQDREQEGGLGAAGAAAGGAAVADGEGEGGAGGEATAMAQ